MLGHNLLLCLCRGRGALSFAGLVLSPSRRLFLLEKSTWNEVKSLLDMMSDCWRASVLAPIVFAEQLRNELARHLGISSESGLSHISMLQVVLEQLFITEFHPSSSCSLSSLNCYAAHISPNLLGCQLVYDKRSTLVYKK